MNTKKWYKFFRYINMEIRYYNAYKTRSLCTHLQMYIFNIKNNFAGSPMIELHALLYSSETTGR